MKCIELFCGCGGMAKGLQQAGIDVVCGIDTWDVAVDTYNNNFDHKALCEDITKLDPDDVASRLQVDNVDMISGGIPCQAFSMAGRRDPNDPRGFLFKDYLRFVKYFNPKFVLIENVVGILTMKNNEGRKVKDIIIEELEDMGYAVSFSTLFAPDYGVPQKRRRVFFVGVKQDYAKYLTFPPAKEYNHETYVPLGDILIPQNEVPAKYFHSQKMIDGFMKRRENNKKNGKGFGAQFVDVHQPCYTISARYYKDGADALVRYNDNEIRKLTEREVARVQTFPDDFTFTGSSRHVYTQIGNAVPVLLAQKVGECIVSAYNACSDFSEKK